MLLPSSLGDAAQEGRQWSWLEVGLMVVVLAGLWFALAILVLRPVGKIGTARGMWTVRGAEDGNRIQVGKERRESPGLAWGEERTDRSAEGFWRRRRETIAQWCPGTWREEFASLQREGALRNFSGEQGAAPLVSVATHTGWADRLTGAVTAFFVALLSGRPFMQTTYGSLADLGAVMESPWIEWGMGWEEAEARWGGMEGARHSFEGVENNRDLRARQRYFEARNITLLYFFNGLMPLSWFVNTDFRQLLGAADRPAFMVNNRGRTLKILAHSKHHGDALRQLGLTERSIFPCGFDFLFQPRPAVVNAANGLLPRFLACDLRLAIHIRTGDSNLRGLERSSGTAPSPLSYFRCAQQIERWALASLHSSSEARSPTQSPRHSITVGWFVMSDSTYVRDYAAARWSAPHRSIVVESFQPAHPVCVPSADETCASDLLADAAVNSIASMFVFSAADVFILTKHSGYGAQSAWISNHHDPVIYYGDQPDCSFASRAPLDFVARHWSGL
ncbi:MAG: hypothetical protein Q8P67_18440 [archaeon]|nr:hypothetical protein [archaeon]